MICPKCGANVEGGYRYVICPKCGEMCDASKQNNNDDIKKSSFNNKKSIINEDGSYHLVFKKPANNNINENEPVTTSNSDQNDINTANTMNNTHNPQSNQTFQPQYTPTGSNQPQMKVSEKQENVLAGIVGAILGSLIGVVVIVIIDQLGYVAAISGFVMAFCAIMGYVLLGGSLSTKGLIISLVIMIVMVWVGERAAWSLAFQKEIYTDESYFTIFRNFNMILEELNNHIPELISNYHDSLIKQYLFAAFGSGAFIVSLFRSYSN